jgi:diguanylate cyclase (GGDEF)-like protein
MIATGSHLQKHQHPLHILIVDDQPSECARLKSAIEKIPDSSYKLSFVGEVSALERMSFYNYDVCIVDDNVSKSNASALIKRHHLGEKLPTIVYGASTISEISITTDNEVHDVLNPEALNPELLEHVIQHAYSQFHFEKQLASLAFTDELTQLASRRMFEYQLDLSLKRIKRTQKPLSVALFNINDFKHVNDKFGHAIGDAALKFFANIISEKVRPYDCVARLAGDTFAVIFEEANKAQAFRAVSDIEMACQAGLFTNGLSVPLFCSTGLIECDSHVRVPLVINRAEKALFDVRSKKQFDLKREKHGFSADVTHVSELRSIGALKKNTMH